MNWEETAKAHQEVTEFVYGSLRGSIEKASELMTSCLRNGGRILTCGNGGSAADAQHFACELVGRFLLDTPPYAALALTTDPSVQTAIGNDYGYDAAFERQVRAFGKADDILLGISTSGNSANVLKASEAAKAIGMKVVSLTGGGGGKLQALADIALDVSVSSHTPRVQEGHLMIVHALCEQIEENLSADVPA